MSHLKNLQSINQLSYLPPVMVGLVDEEEDLVLLDVDPLAVLGDVLKVEGHVDKDLVRVQRPVAVGVQVPVVVMPTPVIVVEFTESSRARDVDPRESKRPDNTLLRLCAPLSASRATNISRSTTALCVSMACLACWNSSRRRLPISSACCALLAMASSAHVALWCAMDSARV